jgi:chloride channel protein, CIC family
MEEAKAHRAISNWYRLQIRARQVFNRVPLRDQQKIYVLTLLIGGMCGLAAVLFHLLLDYFQSQFIYRAAAIPHWWGIPLVLLIPALGGLITGAGLYFYAPEARGSGIPQVKTAYYLDAGRIPARVIPAKMVLSALNIGTGASLGREGPSVQICAAIASLLGRIFAISRRNLQNLIPVGAAAGLAAAFNTPIAAVTFTMEEILANAGARPLGSIVIAAVIAAVIEHSILGDSALFNAPAYRLHSAWELLFYAILGLIAGLAAVAFNTGLLRLRRWFQRQKRFPAWSTPGLGGLILGCIGALALLLTGSASIFGVGYKTLSLELQGSLPLKFLLVLGVCKLVGTVVSYSSGSAGGIFGPSLYIGGMIGGAVGLLTRLVLSNTLTEPGAFALVGMGAVFAGIVRAPVTSIVIIFEMTRNYSIILPLMVANIISYVLATRLSPMPIYDALLLQDGIHLPHAERGSLRHIPVSAAMTREVLTLRGDISVEEAFQHVQSLPENHHAYPVVDHTDRLIGLVTSNDLKRALAAGKAGQALGRAASGNLVHVHPDHTLDTAIIKLGRQGISQLPVVSRKDSGRLLGIITMHDIANALGSEEVLEDALGSIKN